MNRLCFIVACVGNRKEYLKKCIECFKKSKYCNCDIYLYLQGEYPLDVDLSIFKDIIYCNELRGVFTPRYELMKQYSYKYDYTIIIDDDLFMTEDTSFDGCIEYIETHERVGCMCISNTIKKDLVEKTKKININGGMIFPKKSIEIILDYFKDKEKDYTFDCFWLLLWVKGLDFYRDWRYTSIHQPTRKVKKDYSGFNYTLVHKPYVPILTEYFNEPKLIYRHGRMEYSLPQLTDVNENGLKERERCLKLEL